MKKWMGLSAALIGGMSAIGMVSEASAQSATLAAVQARGELACGVTTGVPGFASPNDQNEWTGYDVDICRAVAAAVLGDAKKVSFKPTTGKTRFTVLSSGEIDVLARNTTWTFSRDTDLKLDFVGVNFYDGQGFIIRKSAGVKSALELDGASVCIQSGTTTELNLADYFRANNMKFTSIVVEDLGAARQSYEAGRCDAYTTDRSALAAARSTLAKPDDHVILPEVISKEPLGPLVRHGDNEWGDIVRWTLNTMIIAEEFGLTQSNVDKMRSSTKNPEIRRLLGLEGDMGGMIGLSKDWAYNIIKMVGNLGESYERNVGVNTPIGLVRGVNDLWTRGGLIYAPPMR